MIRDRFALADIGATVGGLTTLAALANLESATRNVDIVFLWLAGALQLGLLLTWVFIPRLPRWVVGGWGLILVATGIGLVITAPTPAEGSGMPWALIGLLLAGILTVVMSAVHTSGSDERSFA